MEDSEQLRIYGVIAWDDNNTIRITFAPHHVKVEEKDGYVMLSMDINQVGPMMAILQPIVDLAYM